MEKTLNTQVSRYPIAHHRNTSSLCASCPLSTSLGLSVGPFLQKTMHPELERKVQGLATADQLCSDHRAEWSLLHCWCCRMPCCLRPPYPWGCPSPNPQHRSAGGASIHSPHWTRPADTWQVMRENQHGLWYQPCSSAHLI